MSKLVILELDGNLENQGFRVTLEIRSDTPISESLIRLKGRLPANPELVDYLQFHWQQKYRNLEINPRIKSKNIIHKGSIQQRRTECSESAAKLSYALKNWLNTKDFYEINLRLREELNRHEIIRVLICSEDPNIQKLPWQQWDFFDRYPKAEVGFSRLESKFSQPLTLPNSKKAGVKVLAIFGHQAGIDIQTDLYLLKSLNEIQIKLLIEPNHHQITHQLWEENWDILFFAGHSETQENIGKIYINSIDILTILELYYGLQKAVERGLKLAIFNSCDGLGLAQQLYNVQIPQMIVMRELVPDRIAQEFLKHFLKAFANHQPLYIAVREARQRLHDDFEREFPCASWLPVIVQQPAATALTWQQLLGNIETSSNPKNSPASRQLSQLTVRNVAPSNLHKQLLAKQFIKKCLPILISSLTATSLVIGIRSLGWLQSWELQTLDLFIRWRPAEEIDPRLLVVEATEKDINEYGFPLPDRVLATTIETLQKYEPKIIGIDIFRDKPVGEGSAKLFNQFQTYQNLIGVCSATEANQPNKPGIKPPSNLPESRLGFTDVLVDKDGILRRHLLFMQPISTDPCITNYAFSTRVALTYLTSQGINPKLISKQQIQVDKVLFNDIEINTGAYQKLDTGGFQILLNYRKVPSRSITISEVLNNQVHPDFIKNKIILIGVTAPISGDEFSTPYTGAQEIYKRTPGILIQAQKISQIISAVLDKRPLLTPWNHWIESLWIGGWSIMGGMLAYQIKCQKLWNLAMAITIIFVIGISFCLFLQGIWVAVIPSAIVVIVSGKILRASYRFYQRS
jgi:CHASE2 domain-containing sensor protein